MPTVADILAIKGPQVHSTTPGATVLQATQKMNQYKLGALIVMQGNDVAGIFTERDVLRRVVAEQKDPATTTIAEVMTTSVHCVKKAALPNQPNKIAQPNTTRITTSAISLFAVPVLTSIRLPLTFARL